MLRTSNVGKAWHIQFASHQRSTATQDDQSYAWRRSATFPVSRTIPFCVSTIPKVFMRDRGVVNPLLWQVQKRK
jgi:hypothetical protein